VSITEGCTFTTTLADSDAGAKDDVDMDGLSETELNSCVPIRCEASLFDAHFISAHGKLLCSKKALLVSF